MKTIVFIIATLFSYINNDFSTITSQEEHKLTATFIGLTDDYYFEFKDTNGKTVIFNEISGEVEVNLFEDETIGKKFEITWEEFAMEETDDDGEPTGEKFSGKRIIAMSEIE